MARCSILDSQGRPLEAEDLGRFHLYDLRMQPLGMATSIAPGEVSFPAPDRPFRIGVTARVPDFGHVFVYADKGGRGYTAGDFDSDAPLPLNDAFAADRVERVRALLEECRSAGVVISPAPRKRLARAAALLGEARAANSPAPHWEALMEALYAGEEVVFERAQQAILRRGARPGFLFGCFTEPYTGLGRPFAERFESLFNYATVPFDGTESEAVLEWVGRSRLMRVGRLGPVGAGETVRRHRNRVSAWEVRYPTGLSEDKRVESTAAEARAARASDPTCFRLACCGDPWLGPGGAAYVRAMLDAKAGFEAVALPFGYAGRDMVEMERMLDTFGELGRPVHISETGAPSSDTEFPWHGQEWTEVAQADWLEQFYTIAFSKPWVEAITWRDLVDRKSAPRAGLLTPEMETKQSYGRLKALVRNWRALA
ncbi:MAG: hypothetical protein M1541_14590 [Acidobacteria bacterium]|nr:hypothetical protein [Acidobacteriota bacterium]